MLATRSVSRLRKCVSKDYFKLMANAFIMSRLDYCKQFIPWPTQAATCSALCHTLGFKKKRISQYPVMKDLHWLNDIVVRINFKIFSSFLFAFITCQIFTSSLTLLISISFYKFLLLIPWLMAIAHFHIMHQKSGTVNHIISNILNVFPFSSNVWEVFFLETIIVHSLFRFKQGILSALRILKYAMKTHNYYYYYYYYWKEWVALSTRISFIITCARALRFESTQIWDARFTVRVCTTNSASPKTAETAVHGCLRPGRVM